MAKLKRKKRRRREAEPTIIEGQLVDAKPIGRPTNYTKELAESICARLADGEALVKICREDGMPAVVSVYRWLRAHPEFGKLYAQAKQDYAATVAEEVTEISDDGRNDWMERLGPGGVPIGWQVNGEHIQRSRLRVDTRKWIAAKLLPKVYGDTQRHEHMGEGGGPILLAPAQRALLTSELLLTTGAKPKPDTA